MPPLAVSLPSVAGVAAIAAWLSCVCLLLQLLQLLRPGCLVLQRRRKGPAVGACGCSSSCVAAIAARPAAVAALITR